ncbi:MAG TPA: alpha-2-macroglobulin, partial [bacterium]|nr:alpha-2-macroglobulin [bacterium]
RPDQGRASITLNVPAERRPEETRLEIRYSPTLAAAMVDALPYLADYPYGCTEQTLNRFLPAVITQKVLIGMGLDLSEIREKRTNLNAQEIGNDRERAGQWKRFDANPVFEMEELGRMVKAGVTRLTAMQNSDGGWGWFSGWGEQSWPHTTAVVVHGLQVARANDVAIVPGVLERGVEWLKKYQAEQLILIRNAEKKEKNTRWKERADDLDAFVYMVLTDAGVENAAMRDFLYRDRIQLSVYAKAMFGLALHKAGDREKRDMLIRNIGQYLVQDDENQTAYLRLPEGNPWWCWYGSETEAEAYYLKLLAATDPKGQAASRLVKYLLNNRKHATYWNSTRDSALVIEAFADYLKASGEDRPDLELEILVDGKRVRQVKIDRGNLFSFENKLVLLGDELKTGRHTVEFRKTGTGPIYFNAYLTNFTLEDPITRAGLEIKVNRKYYRLVREDKSVKAEGMHGQVLDQRVEKYRRVELADLAALKSGDLVEIELKIESKNDYEYIIFEDMKAAGFEPVEVRSGYNRNALGAYMELRDERVCFFTRVLPRGTHSLSYRMRAEIPGRFSALPTRASAMYAPELKANSDEIKLRVTD